MLKIIANPGLFNSPEAREWVLNGRLAPSLHFRSMPGGEVKKQQARDFSGNRLLEVGR